MDAQEDIKQLDLVVARRVDEDRVRLLFTFDGKEHPFYMSVSAASSAAGRIVSALAARPGSPGGVDEAKTDGRNGYKVAASAFEPADLLPIAARPSRPPSAWALVAAQQRLFNDLLALGYDEGSAERAVDVLLKGR